jgi:quinoprotein glucose dehydrogenase
LISGLGIETSDDTFLAWVRDAQRPVSTRVEALKFLASRKSPALNELMEQTLADKEPLLRATSRELVAKLDPIRGLELLSAATEQGDMPERQLAFAALGRLPDDDAASVLAEWFDKFTGGKVEPEYQLDVLEAARASKNKTLQDKIASYESKFGDHARVENFKLALAGGDVERGKRLFTSSAMAQCVRCHKIAGTGGDAGPDLSKIAERNPREYLLQSILEPNAKIAPGFATVTLQLSDGRVVAGILKSEENGKLTIVTPQSQTLVIDAADVDERSQPTSAMPEVFKGLTPAEVRDLVAYLATLK